MKSLDDWLASSDSSDDEQSGVSGAGPMTSGSMAARPGHSMPAVATPAGGSAAIFPSSVSAAGSVGSSSLGVGVGAQSPTTATGSQRSSRMEEARAKMEKLLGQDSMARAATASPSPSPEGSQFSPTMRPSNVPFGMTPVARTEGAVAGFTATTAASPSSSSPQGPMQQVPEGQQQSLYEPVEVMVVDRGTQTVTTVGVQTDPAPPFPPTAPPMAYTPWYSQPPIFGSPVAPHVPQRVDSRPYSQHLHELERIQPKDAAALREQLQLIQNSIDMLISRYNLPPPPL